MNLCLNLRTLPALFEFNPYRVKISRSDISTSQLNALLCLHLWPINLVVFQEPDGETLSWDELGA